MIYFLSNKIAENLKAINPHHPTSVEIMRHALMFLFNIFGTIGLSVLLGVTFDKLTEILIVLLSFAVLRAFSGGYHFNSGDLCVLFSSTSALMITFITITPLISHIICSISIILIWIYAPSGIEERSKIPRKYYSVLKITSAIIVASNFIVVSGLLAVTYLVQSISLIRKEVRI